MAAKNKTATSNVKLSAETAEAIYTTMRRIRAFEEQTIDLFAKGEVKGTAHSYIGEEAVAAAVSANLRDDDFMASNHRGHGHCIAKGADINLMMAELMGRENGLCGGCWPDGVRALPMSLLVEKDIPLRCCAASEDRRVNTDHSG